MDIVINNKDVEYLSRNASGLWFCESDYPYCHHFIPNDKVRSILGESLHEFFFNIESNESKQDQVIDATIDCKKQLINLLSLDTGGKESCLTMTQRQVIALANAAIELISAVDKELLTKYIEH